MNKILVIGSCGAGKSTLSVALSEKSGIPVIHLDSLFWKENWTPSTNEELDAAIRAASKAESWIMDGNYSRTLPMRLELCDCVIFLDLPRYLCLCRILKRVCKYYGKCRPDMGKNCPERLDFSFLQYVWHFKRTQRPKIIEILKNSRNYTVITLKSRAEIKDFISKFQP